MRTERITVSLPADLVAEARRAVHRGTAPSVSAYVTGALVAHQRRERSLAVLADLYGGPPPPDQLDRARRTLATAV